MQPGRLVDPVAAALENESNNLWLSPISVWEFMLLAERGRVRLSAGMPPAAWAEIVLLRNPMHDAPLNREVAVRSRSVDVEQDDPADRFLAATAEVYDLVLVTADERLLRGSGYQTLANR